jgi:RNA polymerase sigma-B factor
MHRLHSFDVARLSEDGVLFDRFRENGSPGDREALVERFLPLARSLAGRYVRRDESFDDVFQVACIGLVKAIDRYEPALGVAFSSFAVPTIAGEIKRYYRDKIWSIYVPRDLRELAVAVDRVTGELQSQLGRKPTIHDVADNLGVEDEDVLEAMHAGHGSSPGGRTATLSPRDRAVIVLRFERELTQAEIARRVGVSQMQVSRILRRSLNKLRTYLSAREGAGKQTEAALH